MLKFSPTLILLAFVMLFSGCARLIEATTSEPIYVHPGKRTVGATIDDRNIETIAMVNMIKAHPGLADARIIVNSHNGVVLLTGQVASNDLRQLASDTVNKISTVRQLHNELQVGPYVPMSTRTYDTWLTTKIKTKLIANKEIDNSRVRVITEAKTVFLMGMVSRREAEIVTDIARTTGGVRKVVRVFEYIN
ncbi:BON domain-containing protein [Cellvibrio sp. PSBB006]|jgi:osmotically-inducible protein OsmY|uniref:BON domain-containing protein n=1 Tax=Cellvibrio sp. PSBB006 TaxID=1987723 RepID=UPI000B3B2E92|nr:BON domain-containing protein [Cellvibrio sp. PSBB006]ARU27449.1 phospholipid-binding protein [Cellvibrio sp. PSBB006]